MCGIAGFIDSKFTKTDLVRMTDTMIHRGPDSGGYFFDENNSIGLGHRRLSIVDLSASANQPFYSESGRYVIVFNGEIYNFIDLKSKYQLNTKTTSDTEVILMLFEKFGVASFNEFNGMFAIAIWDNLEKKLILCRDRVGKKPLYFSFENGCLHFASELKSLLKLQQREKNLEHLSLFLHLGYMPHTCSFYKGIEKLQSGHYLIWEKGEILQKPFWEIEKSIHNNQDISEAEALKKLEQLIETSVAYRMIADVPLGTFLSGGIDSSLVTAIAQKQKSTPIQTSSIGFKEAKFNESAYARKVADHLKTDHHEFILSSKDAMEKVSKIIDVYDEPYIDSSAVPTMLVSEMSRKHVTVALSGDGGDELFMGYGMYDWAKRLDSFPYNVLHQPISFLMKYIPKEQFQRRAELLNYDSNSFLPGHIFSQEQNLFSENEISELMIHSPKSNIQQFFTSVGFEKKSNYSTSELQAYFDFKYYLQEDLNVKVDRASMQYSLETRAPLLDYRIMEFAFSLPENLRKHNGVSKYLLKEILYKHVPKEIFDRPKWGFSIPMANWLKTDLAYLIDDYLNESMINKHQIVRYSKVKNYVQKFKSGEDHYYNRLWALILLHQWMEKMEY